MRHVELDNGKSYWRGQSTRFGFEFLCFSCKALQRIHMRSQMSMRNDIVRNRSLPQSNPADG